jgi:SAM-dependent methyltransferase
MSEWLELNARHWDERVAPHAASQEYALDRFRADPQFLSDVVRFDVARLGELRGLRGVHLQCHIGTDTVSLHRLGARMTGLDFSTAAIEQARGFAAAVDADVDFVQAELYDAPAVLPNEAFDLVFTGIGALCWLPDVRRWAQVVAALLKPGGRLFLREGHPMLWSIGDPRPDGLVAVEFPYFERPEPTIYDEPGTYVETEHEFVHTTSADWNHGLGEIVTALLDVGMTLTMLVEHDSVPWNALPGMMEQLPDGEYRLADRPWRLPHSYTLQAVRSAG